jgi:hypothetical protein
MTTAAWTMAEWTMAAISTRRTITDAAPRRTVYPRPVPSAVVQAASA